MDDVCMMFSLYRAQADDRQSRNDKGGQVRFLYRQPLMTLDSTTSQTITVPETNCCTICCEYHLVGSASYINYHCLPLNTCTGQLIMAERSETQLAWAYHDFCEYALQTKCYDAWITMFA